jgi:hypothetical protein
MIMPWHFLTFALSARAFGLHNFPWWTSAFMPAVDIISQLSLISLGGFGVREQLFVTLWATFGEFRQRRRFHFALWRPALHAVGLFGLVCCRPTITQRATRRP